MFSLARPNFQSTDVLEAAISTVANAGKRRALEAQFEQIIRHCDEYDKAGLQDLFEGVDGAEYDVIGLAAGSMPELYDRQFARGASTKDVRDGLRNAAPHGLCPYCGQGMVATLDHYLPKSKFAGVTVHSRNLVPACRDCNFEKRDYFPHNSNPPVLHPYFTAQMNASWLQASIVPSNAGVPLAAFSVSTFGLSSDFVERAEAHMRVFKLYGRFQQWAAQTLENFEFMIRGQFGRDFDVPAARAHLEKTALQQSGGRPNSWESATYSAMSRSDWYLRSHLALTE